MRRVEERFRSHLVEDESVRALASGRLLGDAVRGRATIGATDRRLLCVSDAGEFVDVRYDWVCSIRRREQTRVEYRSAAGPNRSLRLLGGLAALAVLVVGTVATTGVSAVQGVATAALAAATVALAAAVQSLRTRPGIGRAADQIAVGAGVLALLVPLGVALFTTTVSPPLYGLVTLAGLGLVVYAAGHRTELDGLGIDGRRETLLTVTTVDGETVTLAVDADSTFDRDLEACVHRTDPASVERPLARAPVERPPDGDDSATVGST
ncbi:hypothetical protein Htur_2308 [Haloterrigena turkmenica DSM 5511]|uniref:Uncharacterized protein n=1 Tax=Haloterrigena turkmenica (strain ATCC 51198 / DSM 5511 / JCM 9101 / NCIMB 13204 / VKM B-1734 / 4k) TaxID=543526 RepID=D2RUL6_HALTV|nr:hypothetical protein [Haloterrigena turkmenica]ADB61188.1 hypothetical protein Htur_2308 [Haloterrigena turkmenica DSM 5511]